jgi:FlaA1/EpsC-like NDP-sugar epimerase
MSNFFEGKRVVVTGGSGFIGTHFLLELVEKGAIVITHTHKSLLQIFDERIQIIHDIDLYKIEDCIKYIVDALRKNGLYVQILPEPNNNMLYISWNPSEVSSNIKSLGYTGKGI